MSKTKTIKRKLEFPYSRKIGNAVFSCGAVVPIREYMYDFNKTTDYKHRIKLEGYHAGDEWWSYTDAGDHGEGTGPDDYRPFNLMEIIYK